MNSRLPVEVLERIVDQVWDDPDELEFYSRYGEEYQTFCAISRSSRCLYTRSQFNLLQRVSLLTASQLHSFAVMLATFPNNMPLVAELTVLSTHEKPSPAESFAPIVAGKLANLHTIRIRTEMDHVDDLDLRPIISFHPAAFASLTRFSNVTRLELFSLYFVWHQDLLRLVYSLPHLRVLQCVQIWIKNLDGCPMPFNRGVQLHFLDLAFMPLLAMAALLHSVYPGHVRELRLAPDQASTTAKAQETFAPVGDFVRLESFTFYVPVTVTGAEYDDAVGVISLLNRGVRSITLSHYVHGLARDHVVPKHTMIEALRRNAELLQAALLPARKGGTHVVFQLQGLHGSEAWWLTQLQPILPQLFCPAGSAEGMGTCSIKNVTYSDWSPWKDDQELSARY